MKHRPCAIGNIPVAKKLSWCPMQLSEAVWAGQGEVLETESRALSMLDNCCIANSALLPLASCHMTGTCQVGLEGGLFCLSFLSSWVSSEAQPLWDPESRHWDHDDFMEEADLWESRKNWEENWKTWRRWKEKSQCRKKSTEESGGSPHS